MRSPTTTASVSVCELLLRFVLPNADCCESTLPELPASLPRFGATLLAFLSAPYSSLATLPTSDVCVRLL